MKNKGCKFVVVSPKFVMGGPIVLHTLCRNLHEIGYDAKVLYLNSFEYPDKGKIKYWLNWSLYKMKSYVKKVLVKLFGDNHFEITMDMKMKCQEKVFPFVGKNTIVVYPEIIRGNPLHAKKVVRWLLYYNKNYFQDNNGNPIGYGKNDLFFAYRDVFNDIKLNPDCNLLYTPYIDLELYKRTSYGNRSGKCYIIRKGAGRSDLPKDFDGVVIDNLPEKKKVEIFNICEYCISYDTQTTYSAIAAMCGCISVVIPEKGKSRKDYLATGETGIGCAYGFSAKEISFAVDTKDDVLEYFKSLNQSSIESTKKFISKCNLYFNNWFM